MSLFRTFRLQGRYLLGLKAGLMLMLMVW